MAGWAPSGGLQARSWLVWADGGRKCHALGLACCVSGPERYISKLLGGVPEPSGPHPPATQPPSHIGQSGVHELKSNQQPNKTFISHVFLQFEYESHMCGETLSSRRRENAALIQISKAPMKRLGNVYMRMTDLEYSRILVCFAAKMQTFHKDSSNKVIWKMSYVGRWTSLTPVREAGNINTEFKIVFYVVKTPIFCLAIVDAYLHTF